VVFLIFRSSCQEDENIASFDEKKVMGMCFKEKKRSYKVPKTRKAGLKDQTECRAGRIQWHNHAESFAMKPQCPEVAHDHQC